MKHIYFVLLALVVQQAFSQIQYTGCNEGIPGPYPFTLNNSGTVVDANITRNTFESVLPGPSCGAGVCAFRIIWNITTTRWEIQLSNDGGASYNLLYSNTSDARPNPPSTSLGTWVGETACSGSGNVITTLTGDVQNQILSNSDFELNTNSVKITPNPANKFISVITSKAALESVTVFNLLGQNVARFTNNFERLDVSSLKPNIYLIAIKTKNGNSVTTKLVKQ
jgi:hypothetical protein